MRSNEAQMESNLTLNHQQKQRVESLMKSMANDLDATNLEAQLQAIKMNLDYSALHQNNLQQLNSNHLAKRLPTWPSRLSQATGQTDSGINLPTEQQHAT